MDEMNEMDQMVWITRNIPKTAQRIKRAFTGAVGDNYWAEKYSIAYSIQKVSGIGLLKFKVDDTYMDELCHKLTCAYFYHAGNDNFTHTVFFHDNGDMYDLYIQRPAFTRRTRYKLNADRTPFYL